MKPILRYLRVMIVTVESNNRYTFRVCVTLVIRDLKGMSRIIFSSMACMVLPHFSQYLIKCAIFGKKNYCIWYSVQLLSETFLILKRIQRDIINVHMSSWKVTVILVRFLIELEIPWQFLKRSGIKFYEHPFIGSSVVPCGPTDKHDAPNRWILQYCEGD